MHEHGILLPGNAINRSHPLNRGLVSEWAVLPNRMCGGGLTLRDLCMRNHGVLTNGPTWQGPLGRPGGYGSLYYDGTDDYVSIADSDSLDPSAVTATCWFRLTLGMGWRHLIVKQGAASWTNPYATYCLRLNNVHQMEAWVNDGGVGGNYATSTATVTDNNWHWGGLTYDGTTLLVYLDGLEVATKTISAALNSSAFPLLIGARQGPGEGFGGHIDSVCVYSRALSTSQMSSLFLEQRAGNPNRWNWIRRPQYVEQAGGGGGGNRRRRSIICGAAA